MKTLTPFILAVALLGPVTAWSHGDGVARHGGIVQMAGEIKFELVPGADAVELYLDDHGETVPTAKLSGKLTVLSGGAKSETKLEPAPGDKLVAKGLKLVKGDKVVALVTTADQQNSSARFVIK
ncbi:MULTISPECIES: hypothetical protein [Roseateles]|uniref:DUF5666 domain-containing protein n=1 Tax=Pelomonas caseinilytica TaxID=2906763 RepID=A0ABS8XLW3_9BURK|nr:MULTISPECIES: hypothetical protein [unclassified Roseateles]MCE4540592.1 hypothetical protein [Pelomonas sp. P7]HEV6964256.1 hypothetical protein [Roseateles sp.]